MITMVRRFIDSFHHLQSPLLFNPHSLCIVIPANSRHLSSSDRARAFHLRVLPSFSLMIDLDSFVHPLLLTPLPNQQSDNIEKNLFDTSSHLTATLSTSQKLFFARSSDYQALLHLISISQSRNQSSAPDSSNLHDTCNKNIKNLENATDSSN